MSNTSVIIVGAGIGKAENERLKQERHENNFGLKCFGKENKKGSRHDLMNFS
jgi:hypothetical protein